MGVIKNINPVARVLEEANIIPRLSSTVDKKKALLDSLESRGITLDTVAETIANQFYSGDEVIKDKAIERMLKLTDISKDNNTAPIVNIVIQGYDDNHIQGILVPRD